MHMLSCYQTIAICTLINLSCVILIYLKFRFGKKKKIWINASYIPGKENYDADAASHKKQTKLEWILSQRIFTKTIPKFQFQP